MTAYLLVVTVGVLYAMAAYLLLRRSLGQTIVGLALLANATNLLIFVAAGTSLGKAPLVEPGASRPPTDAADPVPQALILTAIVIGFGVLGFFIALAARAYQITGDDLEALRATDRVTPPKADA